MASSSSSLKAQFYVIRNNGSFVPLIAMDELPTTVIVKDVPRVLEPRETSGMTSIGEYNSRHSHHSVEFVGAKGRDNFIRNINDGSNSISLNRSLMSSKHAVNGLNMERGYPAPPKAYGIQEQAPSSSPSVMTSTHTTPTLTHSTPLRIDRKAALPSMPSTPILSSPSIEPLPGWHDASNLPKANGVKEYCSYWLRHGECDYAQQGCLYKHEMPTDRETLERCGMRDLPRWWRERHGVGSLLSVSSTGTSTPVGGKRDLLEKNWRGMAEKKVDTGNSNNTNTNINTKTASPRIDIKKGVATLNIPAAGTNTSNMTNFARTNVSSSYRQVNRNVPSAKFASGRNNARQPIPSLDDEAAFHAIRQLEAVRASDAMRKADLRARMMQSDVQFCKATIEPEEEVDPRPLSSGTDSASISSSDGDKPGIRSTPGTSSSEKDFDDSTHTATKRKINIQAPPLQDPALGVRVAQHQARQVKARQDVVTEVGKALQLKANVKIPKSGGAGKQKNVSHDANIRRSTPARRRKELARKESTSSSSSVEGGKINKGPKKNMMPEIDLLEDFGTLNISPAIDERSKEVEMGVPGYTPYDHDD